jgi:ubiquinol-cytochrome c reductase iron-sulfur subunit
VAKAKDWLVAALVLLVGKRGHTRRDEAPRLVPKRETDDRAERVMLGLLGLSSLCAVSFVVIYALDRLPAQTQLLGLALGLSLLALAGALIVAGKRLVPDEELAGEYPRPEHPAEQDAVEQLVDEGVDGISRRRLLKLGLLGAGGALGLAAITPALSFGPFFRVKELLATPWRSGRRLVDESGRPLRAADVEEKALYTAFPEGELDLPAELAGYDADGIVAYSKICTHAGCAVSLYRAPLFRPTEPRPALVCPCHYSTFDPSTGGTVVFGPAGRPLPMLPLEIDAKGYLRAKGNFDGPVGPSWWGVRNRRATS